MRALVSSRETFEYADPALRAKMAIIFRIIKTSATNLSGCRTATTCVGAGAGAGAGIGVGAGAGIGVGGLRPRGVAAGVLACRPWGQAAAGQRVT
ncbi:hypothetical protein EYW47_32195 [Paraburkholderia silviterrae]|uniref:Uncharacterized protein n=1 Tax=Paraburkholderia silviterrae TaxID=2528715 RepID=A0A4R5M1X0_9BURK|nr:hypothetical protein EYW47_32195 [Paraburkholderia silviterrae]